jgi:hippurate hydrolase
VTWITTPLVNAPEQVDIVARAARSVLGTENVVTDMAPITGGEDFAAMLEAAPGALVFLGNGVAPDGTIHNVHTPHYDFNDEAIGAGVAFWVRLVRQQLSTEAVPGGR